MFIDGSNSSLCLFPVKPFRVGRLKSSNYIVVRLQSCDPVRQFCPELPRGAALPEAVGTPPPPSRLMDSQSMRK